jgi:tRNA modification GTPase
VPTIAAIATPPGRGGIGIVRVSGPDSKGLLARIFLPFSPGFENFRPWTMYRGRVLDEMGEPLDDALAIYMPGPHTFTGEDSAELHCHGGNFLLRAVLASLIDLGARQAQPGEFSRRAFLNGRMDLSQAEAIAEMISAPSREALRYGLNRLDGMLGRFATNMREALDRLRTAVCLAIDFPEDEHECLPPESFAEAVGDIILRIDRLLAGARRAQIMQTGAMVVLAGAVNAGKSSLANALLGRDRAIVSDAPGTTRDYLEEPCDLLGMPTRLVDTAGLRTETEGVEAQGVAIAREKLAQADLILLVVDGERLGRQGASRTTCPDPVAAEVLAAHRHSPILLVWNKLDLCAPARLPPLWARSFPSVAVSALTGEKVDTLVKEIRSTLLDRETGEVDGGLAPNERQARCLLKAKETLAALRKDIESGQPYDCCANSLDAAALSLGEITGYSSSADVLDRVFSQFCIGK